MAAAPSLLELQRQFMAALYDADTPGPIACIAGNGLAPEARLRIYRNSCTETQIAALRTSYPAVLALAGDAFFDQTARGFRRVYPSTSGNLQAFGARLADYLETLTACRGVPYLPDVARLEWLRQEAVLAQEGEAVATDAFLNQTHAASGQIQVMLHASLRLIESRYPILAIWHYALQPTPGRLTLGEGEQVALWREGGEVAMGALDPASFACLRAIQSQASLAAAQAAAVALDPAFDLSGCIGTLLEHGLVIGTKPFAALDQETTPC